MRIALLIGLFLPVTLVSQIAPGPPVQLIDMHMHIWEPLPWRRPGETPSCLPFRRFTL